MKQAGGIEIINQWFKNNHDKNIKGFHGKGQLFQSNCDKYIIASREEGRKQWEWTDGMYHQRNKYYKRISQSFQSLSCVWLFVTPWTETSQASLSITNSQSLLKLMSIESVMPSNNVILCHPLLLLPSVFPSIRVFSSESVLHISWPKYWSFSFSISPSNECLQLISFRMDCFDILAIQGTLKSLLQHHSSKALIFSAQLSLWSNSHIHTWLLEKSWPWLDGRLLAD